MAKELTRKQREVLALIRGILRATNKAPSYRELAATLSVDVRTAYQHVVALEKKGVVVREGGKRKRIRLHPDYQPERGFPVLGRVPAGAPLESEADVGRYLDFDQLLGRDDLFALEVKGDSMVDRGIVEGDYVLVHSQVTARDGNIVVAALDGECTVKTLKTLRGKRYLCPENKDAKYSPILLEQEGARLLGRVIWVLRDVA